MHRESLTPIYFSCGPSKKFKDWNANIFQNEWINRSHIYDFKVYAYNCLNKIRTLLKLPSDYEILFVPGSGSGAIWCGFLNCLLPNSNVQVAVSGYFSQIWYSELNKEFGNFGIKADFIKYDDDFNLSDINCNKDYIITGLGKLALLRINA
jgi:phosphoserine aminotransferase